MPPDSPDSSALRLYGIHVVRAALANPERTILHLWATDAGVKSLEESRRPLPSRLKRTTASARELNTLLPEDAVHQGVAIDVLPLANPGLETILGKPDNERRTVVMLDQVTDPQNVGAILRSAAAFGATALLMQRRGAPSETGALAKAASGALELIPVIRVTNLGRTLDELAAHGFWRIGLAGDADLALHEIEPAQRMAIVLGAEGKGLRRLTRENCDWLARLPVTDAMNSLNVSAAAAVALYELSLNRAAL